MAHEFRRTTLLSHYLRATYTRRPTFLEPPSAVRAQSAERQARHHGRELFYNPSCQPAERAVEMLACVTCTRSREAKDLSRFDCAGKSKQLRRYRLRLRKRNRPRFVSCAAHYSEDNATSHCRLCAWTKNTRSGIFRRRFHRLSPKTTDWSDARSSAYRSSGILKPGGSRMNPQIIREFLQELSGNFRDCDSMARMIEALTVSVNAESSIFGGKGCGFSSAINRWLVRYEVVKYCLHG
jgi:hypothetical protein